MLRRAAVAAATAAVSGACTPSATAAAAASAAAAATVIVAAPRLALRGRGSVAARAVHLSTRGFSGATGGAAGAPRGGAAASAAAAAAAAAPAAPAPGGAGAGAGAASSGGAKPRAGGGPTMSSGRKRLRRLAVAAGTVATAGWLWYRSGMTVNDALETIRGWWSDAKESKLSDPTPEDMMVRWASTAPRDRVVMRQGYTDTRPVACAPSQSALGAVPPAGYINVVVQLEHVLVKKDWNVSGGVRTFEGARAVVLARASGGGRSLPGIRRRPSRAHRGTQSRKGWTYELRPGVKEFMKRATELGCMVTVWTDGQSAGMIEVVNKMASAFKIPMLSLIHI